MDPDGLRWCREVVRSRADALNAWDGFRRFQQSFAKLEPIWNPDVHQGYL
jgi:hypothetical protein